MKKVWGSTRHYMRRQLRGWQARGTSVMTCSPSLSVRATYFFPSHPPKNCRDGVQTTMSGIKRGKNVEGNAQRELIKSKRKNPAVTYTLRCCQFIVSTQQMIHETNVINRKCAQD